MPFIKHDGLIFEVHAGIFAVSDCIVGYRIHSSDARKRPCCSHNEWRGRLLWSGQHWHVAQPERDWSDFPCSWPFPKQHTDPYNPEANNRQNIN